MKYCYLLGKEGYVFGSGGLFVCLFVCGLHYSKHLEQIRMKFYEGVLRSTVKNFDGDVGILRWVNEQTNTPSTIVLAYPDHGTGNDQEPLGLAFHHQGPAFLQ